MKEKRFLHFEERSHWQTDTFSPAFHELGKTGSGTRNRYAAALSDLETEEQQQLTAFEELKQSNEVRSGRTAEPGHSSAGNALRTSPGGTLTTLANSA